MVSPRWVEWRRTVDLGRYDARWQAMADRGEPVHGEADFIDWLVGEHLGGRASVRVLDAGCGTGRLAIELVNRGHSAMGVDLDPDMIDRAVHKAPHIGWKVADLANLELGELFDLAVMAGNIPLFCAPGAQADIVASIGAHLPVGGLLVCGWSQEVGDASYRAGHFEDDIARAGFTLLARFSTWDREPFDRSRDYAVLVARRGVTGSQ